MFSPKVKNVGSDQISGVIGCERPLGFYAGVMRRYQKILHLTMI
jgi:hypothetical protein